MNCCPFNAGRINPIASGISKPGRRRYLICVNVMEQKPDSDWPDLFKQLYSFSFLLEEESLLFD